MARPLGCRLFLGALFLVALAATEKNWVKHNRIPVSEDGVDPPRRPDPEGAAKESKNYAGYGDPSKPLEYVYAVVCRNGTSKALIIVDGKACDNENDQIALGRYANRVNETGWGVLEVETTKGFPMDVQAYAAGAVEGYLTKIQIYYHYRNTIETLCVNYTQYCKDLYSYLTKHLDWVREQVISNTGDKDPYWRHVKLVFTQVTGIYDSYMKRSLKPAVGFDLTPIYMIQLSGELFDLNKFLHKKPDPQEYPEAGKCSGLVKLAPGNTDLFFSHVAMSGLNTMNRVLKLYKFGYDKSEVPGHTVSFSGYAGAITSADDYTLTSAGLASIETTHAIFNDSLYQYYIKPQGQVHCWVRSFISNALTKSSKSWVEMFGRFNSGTYNNQWTVVDYKKFTPGKPLPNKDVVWILEQVPGTTDIRDMTWFVNSYSYFPSYNVPYLPSISKLTGFAEKGRHFNWYKWGASPRAKIFERDHHRVVDIDSLTTLMRYNDYLHDEFALCKCSPVNRTAEAGISARGDLNPVNGTWEVESMGFRNHAGLDYKGTNYEMFKKLRFRAWGGPPFDPLPPFDWRTTKVEAAHFGQPDVWNFTFIDLVWEADVGVDPY